MAKQDRKSIDGADVGQSWKLHDALETYGIRNWSKGYFGINKLGHVVVHPDKNRKVRNLRVNALSGLSKFRPDLQYQ